MYTIVTEIKLLITSGERGGGGDSRIAVQQSRNTNFPTMKALKLSYMLHKFKGKKFRELRYQFRELRYSTSKKISYVGNLNSPPPKKKLRSVRH